ncbi:MAG: GBS Bsp-like repeat-containing protein, partial [Clostridiales Family XIII bacterium]|nr:GBS Bsp-like repeat-containing protein [Clostridiales Family XIII bacterium]
DGKAVEAGSVKFSPGNIAPVSYMQYDSRWSNIPFAPGHTIINSGCGTTVAAMIVATLRDAAANPATASNFALVHGYMTAANPHITESYFPDYLNAYGIFAEKITPGDLRAMGAGANPYHDRALQEILNGNWVICRMGPGNWTSTGHFLLWYDQSGDTAFMRDPSYVATDHTMAPLWKLRSQVITYYVVHVNGSPRYTTSSINVTNVNMTNGTFRVQLSDAGKHKASSAKFEVWSESGGKDDAIVYDAVKSGDVFYKDINIENHNGGEGGTYRINAEIASDYGSYTIGPASTVIYRMANMGITVSPVQLNEAQTAAYADISCEGMPAGMDIRTAVWSVAGGQDDLVWHGSEQTLAGRRSVIDLSRHRDSGTYNAHTYAYIGGTAVFIGASAFTVAKPQIGSFRSERLSDGRYKLTVTGLKAPSGISRVQIPTWSRAGGQDDLVWYAASRESVDDGNGEAWSAILQPGSHKYGTGTYDSHVYIYAGSGVQGVYGFSWQMSVAPKTEVTASLSADQRAIGISATNAGMKSAANNVRFAVWSVAGGQDDLVWYTGGRNGDYWSANVNVADHRSAGVYNIHAYNGNVFIGASTVNVAAASASAVGSEALPDGTYRVKVTGANAVSGIARVQIPTWSATGGQDDIIWYEAVEENGEWAVYVKPSSHGGAGGSYTSHAYITSNNGVMSFAGGASYTVNPKVDETPAAKSVTAVVDPSERFVSLKIENPSSGSPVSALKFAVWSQAGGQDDLIWYSGLPYGKGWVSSASISRHRTAGLYNVHVYASVRGRDTFVGATAFTVKSPVGAPAISAPDASNNYKVTVSGSGVESTSPSGVAALEIAVWGTAGGQNDLKWYEASKNPLGDWIVAFRPQDHLGESGTYFAHVYVNTGNGIRAYAGGASVSVPGQTLKFSVSDPSGTQMKMNISVERAPSAASGVRFAVWSETGGQDDIVWYNGTKSGEAWRATVDITRHRTAGRYQVHVYGYIGGKNKFLGATTFNISGASSNGALSAALQPDGTVRLALPGITAPSGITAVQFPVWSRSDQSDIYWYTAKKEGDSYVAYIQPGLHKYYTGNFNLHVYATGANGVKSFVCSRAFAMPQVTEIGVGATVGASDKTVRLSAGNISRLGSISEVQFAVWSNTGGQDDLRWYKGTAIGEYWFATANIGGYHKTAGAYSVHIYGKVNGTNRFLASTTFDISQVNLLAV